MLCCAVCCAVLCAETTSDAVTRCVRVEKCLHALQRMFTGQAHLSIPAYTPCLPTGVPSEPSLLSDISLTPALQTYDLNTSF